MTAVTPEPRKAGEAHHTVAAGYGGTKSALHFDAKKGLPLTLVRKLLKTRLAEIKARR